MTTDETTEDTSTTVELATELGTAEDTETELGTVEEAVDEVVDDTTDVVFDVVGTSGLLTRLSRNDSRLLLDSSVVELSDVCGTGCSAGVVDVVVVLGKICLFTCRGK